MSLKLGTISDAARQYGVDNAQILEWVADQHTVKEKGGLRYWLAAEERDEEMRWIVELRWALTDDYSYLCCNCGHITPFTEWTFFHRDDEGEWEPAREGEEDPMCLCPVCKWEHEDTDGNPGIIDGAKAEVEAQRSVLAQDELYLDGWAEIAKEIT